MSSNTEVGLNKKRSFLFSKTENNSLTVFLAAMIVSLLVFVGLCCYYGNGYNRFTFYKAGEDMFMDFFNSVRDATQGIDCYGERRVIYPPLANCYYLFCSRFMTDAYCNTDIHGRLAFFDVRANIMPFLITTIICCVLFGIFISHNLKKEKPVSVIATLFLIINVPMLRLIERGNILFIALVLVAFFIGYRDSENKVIRELSYISLALAAGIKLYPALFGILLLFDKKFKEAIRTVIYGILAFVLPFAFYGGIEGFKLWYRNIRSFSEFKGGGVELEGSTTLETIFYVFKHFGKDVHVSSAVHTLMIVLPILIVLLFAFLTDKYWKKILAVSVAMILVPGAAQSYTMVIFLVSLLYMFNSEEIERFDYGYLAILTFEFMYYPFPFVLTFETYSVNSGMTFFVTMGLLFLFFVETIHLLKNKLSHGLKSAH